MKWGGFAPRFFFIKGVVMEREKIYLVVNEFSIVALFTNYYMALDYCKKNNFMMCEL